MIVQTRDPVTLLGGRKTNRKTLSEALSHAPFLVAADGGADQALAAGRVPQAVIGDMDSLSNTAQRSLPQEIIHPIPEQDSTDFAKALRNIAAPFILGVGFVGGRVDHALSVLSYLAQHHGPPCILIGKQDVIFTARSFAFAPPIGTRLSLFPMKAVRGRSEGLEWPIEGLAFHPFGQIGTSNRTTGAVSLEFDGAGMLVITPRAVLGQVIAAHLGR